MRSYDSFGLEFEYNEYLERRARRGLLPETSVDATAQHNMLAQLLDEHPAPGFYVEIGPGSRPYFAGSSRGFSGDVRYVGIDGGKSEYRPNRILSSFGWTEYEGGYRINMPAAAKEIALQPNARFASLLWGDAQQLPFAHSGHNDAAQIKEVFMRDVLLQPGVHPRSIQRICSEQARVLAKDGICIIRETTFEGYYGATEALSHRFLDLIACLENAGFKKRLLIAGDSKAFGALLAQFPGESNSRPEPDGYYLICQQGQEGLQEGGLRQKIARMLGRIGL